jgi:hypothetical protein
MTPHLQTIRAERPDGHTHGGIPGNCLQTVVASLLDLDVDEVPHFAVYLDWFGAMRRWARERDGDFTYFPIPVPDQYADAWASVQAWMAEAPDRSRFLIIDGPSPRGDFWHVAVGNADLSLAHDPHPSQAGLVEVKGVIVYCSPYDPAPVTLELTA